MQCVGEGGKILPWMGRQTLSEARTLPANPRLASRGESAVGKSGDCREEQRQRDREKETLQKQRVY